MKLVDVKCKDCGHVQEDYIKVSDKEPLLDDCKACGGSDMSIVTGRLLSSSSSSHKDSGAGPWD